LEEGFYTMHSRMLTKLQRRVHSVDVDAAKNVGEAAQAKDANTRLTGMTIGEAKLILGLEDQKQVTREQILEVSLSSLEI
jgi:hypothetical protein